ncbi:hypothetical protein GCM10023196_020600 [Actinoallomurus vinaceus]|uniref:Uncharacterized protein n=1 Tax=Actinoallomurus vinaceus TaxID=1080074 RepID=A0ABP8U7G3_9ACTN
MRAAPDLMNRRRCPAEGALTFGMPSTPPLGGARRARASHITAGEMRRTRIFPRAAHPPRRPGPAVAATIRGPAASSTHHAGRVSPW